MTKYSYRVPWLAKVSVAVVVSRRRSCPEYSVRKIAV